MRLLVNIDRSVVTDPRVVATITRGFLFGLIAYNRVLLRTHRFKPLYESGVRYKREPVGAGVEELADAVTVYRRGYGDCEDLCALRCAELQEQGIKATPKIYWRPIRTKRGKSLRLFHVQVRLPDGSVEDPSRFLGM